MSARRRAVAGTLLLALAGCAFTNPRNTPLVTAAEELLAPDKESVAATLAFFPVALPLGLLDVFIVHPIQVLDDCGRDAADLTVDIWDHPPSGIASRAYFFLPLTVTTLVAVPIWFVLDFAGRACFDIDPHEPDRADGSAAPPADPRGDLVRRIDDLRRSLEQNAASRKRMEQSLERLDAERRALEAALARLEAELRDLPR